RGAAVHPRLQPPPHPPLRWLRPVERHRPAALPGCLGGGAAPAASHRGAAAEHRPRLPLRRRAAGDREPRHPHLPLPEPDSLDPGAAAGAGDRLRPPPAAPPPRPAPRGARRGPPPPAQNESPPPRPPT